MEASVEAFSSLRDRFRARTSTGHGHGDRNVRLCRRIGIILLSSAIASGLIGGMSAVAQAQTRQGTSSSQIERRQARPGDTLWSFAAQATPRGGDVSETVSAIRRLNHLTSSQIQVGQVLRVPKA
jgi:hypothetical protein